MDDGQCTMDDGQCTMDNLESVAGFPATDFLYFTRKSQNVPSKREQSSSLGLPSVRKDAESKSQIFLTKTVKTASTDV